MRGVVEIYKQGKLVHSEDNLIVDGASELLADIFTVSPTYATIPSASSLLDTSNYTIQAISFGKGNNAYGRNAHYYTDVKDTFINSLGQLCIVTSSNPVLSGVAQLATSAYTPDIDLPEYPSPTDILLGTASKVTGVTSGLETYTVLAGQNVNYLSVNNTSGLYSNSSALSEQLLGVTTSSNAIGSILGCYPDSSANGGSNFYMFSSVDGSANTDLANLTFSGTLSGGFNSASSMDHLGFVNMIMSSVQDSTYSLSSSYSGLTISAGSDFSSTGEVLYEVMIASGDARGSNLYGGISTMGLWSIDGKSSMVAGNSPPFTFNTLNTNRTYKLFSRKVFNTDITATFPEGVTSNEAALGKATTLSTDDIKVIWRLKFL
jgi:hypothetical protein